MSTIDFDSVMKEFYKYLGDVLSLYEASIPVLKTKLDAIACDNIEVLDKCIQTQQVFILKTKTFESKVADYQTRLGITAGNLTDMIGQLPSENRLMFYDLLGQFEITLKEFRYHNDKCQTLLHAKLYTIDKKLRKMQVKKDNTIYQNNAREAVTSSYVKSFEAKI